MTPANLFRTFLSIFALFSLGIPMLFFDNTACYASTDGASNDAVSADMAPLPAEAGVGVKRAVVMSEGMKAETDAAGGETDSARFETDGANGKPMSAEERIARLEARLQYLEKKMSSMKKSTKPKAPFKRVAAESDEDIAALEADIAGKAAEYDAAKKTGTARKPSEPDGKKEWHKWDLSLGGRFFYDGMSTGGISSELTDVVGDISSESELRKCRIAVNGSSHTKVNFKLEFELAGGDVDYTDVYLSLPISNIGKTHIGRQKEPFGMEQANSSNNLAFMERSLVTRSLMPGRSTGITFLHRNAPTDGVSWQFGYFRNTDSKAIEDDKSGQNLTMRWQYDTRCVNQGQELIHFGGGYSRHKPEEGILQIKGKTGGNMLPTFGDTGALSAGSVDILGLEFACQFNNLSFQTEYAKTIAHLDAGGNADFSGFYVQGGWFLTGEHKRYTNRYGALTKVYPKTEFKNWSGGALQFVARYHELELNDRSEGISGGEIREFDMGFNWYLHKDSRIMLNYLRPKLDDLPTANVVQMRFQVNF